jgi:hypothetical protein
VGQLVSHGSKYPGSEQLEQRWESSRQSGRGVTIRTLIAMANEAGAHINLAQQLDAAAFDDLSKPDAVAKSDTTDAKPCGSSSRR